MSIQNILDRNGREVVTISADDKVRSAVHAARLHGSWLDLAESELGVLTSQCLSRRIADKQRLIDEMAAWERDRNAKRAKANWHFTTADARIKLKRLYPSI